MIPVSPQIEREARIYIPDKLKARSVQTRVSIRIDAALNVRSPGLLDVRCRPAKHGVIDVRFESANRIAQIFCAEVRYSISEESEKPEIALVAEVILPDNTTANAEFIRRTDMDSIHLPRTSVNVVPAFGVTSAPAM